MTRSQRRHYAERMKKRVATPGKHFCAESPTERTVGVYAKTRKPCSAHCCGNPRKWWREKTVQERRESELGRNPRYQGNAEARRLPWLRDLPYPELPLSDTERAEDAELQYEWYMDGFDLEDWQGYRAWKARDAWFAKARILLDAIFSP